MRSVALVLLAAGTLGACTQMIDAPEASFTPTGPKLAPNESLLQMNGARMDDNFGTQVVLEGDELIVAAPNAELIHTLSSAEGACDNVIDAPGAGRVVVFDHGVNGWMQIDEIRRTGVQPDEGTAHYIADQPLPIISIARAGNIVAIGVPAAAVTPCDGARETVEQAGKVHVFIRANGRWVVEKVLTANPPSPAAFLGLVARLR